MNRLKCFFGAHEFIRVLSRTRLCNGIWLNVFSARCKVCGVAGVATGRERESVTE